MLGLANSLNNWNYCSTYSITSLKLLSATYKFLTMALCCEFMPNCEAPARIYLWFSPASPATPSMTWPSLLNKSRIYLVYSLILAADRGPLTGSGCYYLHSDYSFTYCLAMVAALYSGGTDLALEALCCVFCAPFTSCVVYLPFGLLAWSGLV